MVKKSWISVAEAAQLLQKTDRHVRRLCNAGTLDHRMDGKAYLVSIESVHALLPDASEATEEPVSESSTSPDVDAQDTSAVPDRRVVSRAPKAEFEDLEPKADTASSTADILRTSDMAADVQTQECPDMSGLLVELEKARRTQESLLTAAAMLIRHFRSNQVASDNLSGVLADLLPASQASTNPARRWLRRSAALTPWLIVGIAVVLLLAQMR